MRTLRQLLLAALACSTIGGALALELDPFDVTQTADSTIVIPTGLGDAERTLALLGPSSLEVDGGQLAVTGDVGGVPLLTYEFDGGANLTAFDSLVLMGVTASGAPDIVLDIFDTVGNLESQPLTAGDGDYAISFSDFTLIDFTQVETLGFRFFNTGSPFTVTATSIQLSAVPEPASTTLLITGCLLLAPRRRLRPRLCSGGL